MGWTLVSTTVAPSHTAFIEFTINTDYDEIMFVVTHYRPYTDEQELEWQVKTSSYGSYNRGIQSNNYNMWQNRGDGGTAMEFYAGSPWWQDSGDAETQAFIGGEGNGEFHSGTGGNAAQMAGSGELTIYRPQDTTHWKHWDAKQSNAYTGNGTLAQTNNYPIFTSGYIKEAEALTGIRFKERGGNGIANGTSSMYGLA